LHFLPPFERLLPSLDAGFSDPAPYPFPLEQVENLSATASS